MTRPLSLGRPRGLAVTLLLLSAALGRGLAAQDPAVAPRLDLTVADIMRGPELVGREPSNVRWSPDGAWIHFEWVPPGTAWDAPLRPFRVRARAGAVPEELARAMADSLEPALAEGFTDRRRNRKVVSVEGDLYLVTLPGGAIRRLTATAAQETALGITPEGDAVFYQESGNLFRLALGDGATAQLTDLRTGPAPPDPKEATGQRGALVRDETRLLVAVRERKIQDSLAKELREARQARRPRPVWLEPRERVVRFDPSPNGGWALVVTTRPPAGTPGTVVPNYVTDSGYTGSLPARSKVGDAQATRRVGLVETATGTVEWLHPIPGDSTGHYAALGTAGWNDAGTEALLRTVSADRTTRRLHRVQVGTPAVIGVIDVLTDSAWIGGPCVFCGGWLPGEAGIWFVSEADGWAHLYTMATDGTRRIQRTRGDWEVLSAELTPARTHFALHTSEGSVYERHAWLLPVEEGRSGQRLTTSVGGHSVVWSPDGRWLADVYSRANRPGELFLQRAAAGAEAAQLTTSPTEAWLAYDWVEPEIITIPASDGVAVPARIYRPSDVGAPDNGAAVIFVHGAGYLHNVHRWWSSYYREYMFHHLLASRGYVVLDIDYRGSAGYGREWRTAIYRHMGGRDLQDQVDGARYLQREFGIPPDRVGIYGGSYGGFITLMALFTEPSWFGAGAALRSVTDWAHYNHPYTANILNEPQIDSTAYRRSSPIWFAEGLEDPLLMAHGMVDVNVHFQDIVRLTQRLIELGKTDWELAVYPVEDHGFVRPDSWTDEYRRILDLFDRHLLPE